MKYKLKAAWGIAKWFLELFPLTFKCLFFAVKEVGKEVFTSLSGDAKKATTGADAQEDYETRQLRRNQELIRKYNEKKR